MTNCNFTGNKATGTNTWGGAVYFDSDGDVRNCNFTDNTATYYGGGVSFYSNGTVSNCNFVDNSVTYAGGAVIWRGSGSVENCNFTNNKASDGGAVDFFNNGNVTNCNFTDNQASRYGGAVLFSSNGTVTNCNFTDNQASRYGGAVLFNNYGNVSNCNFTGNTLTDTDSKGGAVYFWDYGSVENCNFSNNSAVRGGAVYFDENSEGNVVNCKFTNNSARYGGAIDFNGTGTVENCNFINNKATGTGSWGGAIYIYSGTVTNCNFTDNTAGDWGGAIMFASAGTITNCNFTNNKATGDYGRGGAVYFLDEGTVKNCNFTDNKVTGDESFGGAVYFYKNSEGDVTNCNFSNNSAVRGGAVYFDENSEGNVVNCKFTISNSEFDINNSTSLEEIIFGATISNSTINGESVNPINNTKSETQTILSINATHLSIGEKISIIADVLDETYIDGSVDLYINGILIKTVTSGDEYVHTPNEIGVYNIIAKFKGDSDYTQSQSVDKIFTVGPKVSIAQNVSIGDNGQITMDFEKNITGKIVIKVDGKTFGVPDIEEGVVNFTFSTSKLIARNHTVTFLYEENIFDANILNFFDEITDQYVPVEYEMYISPLKTSVQESEPSENNTYIMQFTENVTGTVKVFVNGQKAMVVEIINGIAIIDLSAYKDGNYDITFVYSGDDIYDGFTMEIELKNPKISAKNTNALYTAGQKYSVTVYDKEGAIASGVQVIFKIGNKQVAKATTNSKGVATYKVTNVPGSYKITATALGVSATKTLTVKHLVSLKSVTVKRSAKKLVLQATLSKVNKKYLKNKKVTFKFNGKTYKAKTNSKGVAKVTIKSTVLKKLKAGKKVTYQATYLKDTVKKTVKVKK